MQPLMPTARRLQNTEARDETNDNLEAHVIERKDMQSRNAVL